jgi:acyl-CoA synthetase (NDP forming)
MKQKYIFRIMDEEDNALITMHLDGSMTAPDEASASEAGRIFFESMSVCMGALRFQSRNEGIQKAIDYLESTGTASYDALAELESMKVTT